MTDPQVPAQPDPTTQPTQPVPALGQQPPPPPPPPPPAPQATAPYSYPSPQPYGTAATLPPPTYATAPQQVPWAAVRPQAADAPPPSQQSGRNKAVLLSVGAVVAGLVLLLAGFGLGRATAPSSGGPQSLVDAVRMAQQGTLPCGTAGPNDRVGGFITRLCQLAPGQNGPGFGPFGPFGGNGNGNGKGTGDGSGNGSAG
jgi:outer membrane biosynthesis protein TonB